ncbi:MAG: translation initiation factor IF-2 N-terminal domain-containing protein, partial [Deltaproteobacteria bacterium]
MPRHTALKENMAESDKKEKGNVEEKRVKATVIRRRLTKVEPKAEAIVEAVPAETKAAPLPPMPPEEAVVRVKEAAAEAGKKPLKKAAKAPNEGAKKGARSKARGVEAEDIEAEFEAELEAEAAEEAAHTAEPEPSVILPPIVPAPEGKTRPAEAQAAVAGVEAKPGDKQLRREVTVFQKEPELKKFYTARRPIKKGKGYHPKDFRASRPGAAQLQTRPSKKTELTVPKAAKRVIRIVDAISVAELSQRLGVKAGEIIKKLMSRGIMATV